MSDAVIQEAVRVRLNTADWLQKAVADQEGRQFLWTPVWLTFGVWTYFGLPREPALAAIIIVAILASMLLWIGRFRSWLRIPAIIALGLVLAWGRAQWIATPVLRATSPEVVVAGTVQQADHNAANRLVLVVEPLAIEGLRPENTPKRIRLTAPAKAGNARAGDRIAIKARLAPLPSPVEPDGFDYGRKLWFEGIGGTGRIIGPINVTGQSGDFRHWLDQHLTGLRLAIGQRIRAQLDGEIASIAEALITGERAAIPKDVNHSLLVSGLFHVLSISGLHMWMVAGGVFWVVRALLALSPALALRYPIKKWAAVAALATGWFYMLLADSGVATERSFIMIAVVFFAVLVDRPALSARNLAIAAIIVLLFNPEAAIDASFQMSFFAVLGLVAFYEVWSRRERPESHVDRHWLMRLLWSMALSIVMALVTSAIAGGISSIPAAYHFGRVAPYGIIANGLAFPVIGLVVMPMALAAALLMPLGLESLPLYAMGEGIRLVLTISDWVAGFPDAYMIAARPDRGAMMLMAFGAAAFCLIRGQARAVGLVVLVAGLGWATTWRQAPDVLVDSVGGNVAFRNEDGLLVPALPRRARFSVEKWLQANGEEVTPAEAAKRTGWTCRKDRCDTVLRGRRITYAASPESAAITCTGIDILISRAPLHRACPAVPLRIDRFDLWRHGAHALQIMPDGVTILTARSSQGQRPWSLGPLPRRLVFSPR